jgi:hypothetical protein
MCISVQCAYGVVQGSPHLNLPNLTPPPPKLSSAEKDTETDNDKWNSYLLTLSFPLKAEYGLSNLHLKFYCGYHIVCGIFAQPILISSETNNFLSKSIGKVLPEKRDSKVAVAFLRSPEAFTGNVPEFLRSDSGF